MSVTETQLERIEQLAGRLVDQGLNLAEGGEPLLGYVGGVSLPDPQETPAQERAAWAFLDALEEEIASWRLFLVKWAEGACTPANEIDGAIYHISINLDGEVLVREVEEARPQHSVPSEDAAEQ
jgi:hypothetical protein